MKICFPARKANGENYTTLDEMMKCVTGEPKGSWLAGTNGMWHGGIHISEKSAPGSVLTPETKDKAVPLQCMAEGEVVAWRINRNYLTNTYANQELQYSTTFVLVKSVCKPDPEKETSWLEFYSLYLGLAPLSAFEKHKCMKVIARDGVKRHPQGRYESSQSSTAEREMSAVKEGNWSADARVIILKEETFTYNNQKNQPFGLAQEIDVQGKVIGKPYWVTTSTDNLIPDGEEYAHLPVWMKQGVDQGIFDTVVKPATPLTLSAGDAIGFCGVNIVPIGAGDVATRSFIHLEVITTDSRMPGFLDNPARLTTGRKYIRLREDGKLYNRNGDTFTENSAALQSDIHRVLPEDKCNPFTDSAGKRWFQVSQQSWMNQDGVDEFPQYALKELGFTALEEGPTTDMTKSLHEGWMRSLFDWVSEEVKPARGMQQKQVSAYYKSTLRKMDKDKDGSLSGTELYNATHHPELGVRDIVARLVVKHDSEWFGGSSHNKWAVFFQNYDPPRVAYAKKWLDDMEWMSHVEPFISGQPVWHMHPVVFMDAVKYSSLSIEEARVRAFMRMLRVGEGTVGERGYETLFGGQSFISNYHKDFSNHPQISIARGNLTSSAAGAYQIMGYTWNDPNMVSHRANAGIVDFTPKSQDEFCVLIFKYKRKHSLNKIISGDIDGALDILSYEWASLPPGRYGQPAKSKQEALALYNHYLDEELAGKTDLHLDIGYITTIAGSK